MRLRRVRARKASGRKPTLLMARSSKVALAALLARGMRPGEGPGRVPKRLILLKPKTPKGARAMVRAGFRIKRLKAKADAPAAKAAIRAAAKARALSLRAEAARAAMPGRTPRALARAAAWRATQAHLARRAAAQAALLKGIGQGPVTRARRARGILSRQALGAARGARVAARNAARALAAGAAHLGRRVSPRPPLGALQGRAGRLGHPLRTPLDAARAEANRTRAVLTRIEMVRQTRRPGAKSAALAAARAEAQAAAEAAEAKAAALARTERVRAAKAQLATPGARMLVEWEAEGPGARASMANEGVTKALTQAIRLKETAARGARQGREGRGGPDAGPRAGRVPKAPVIRLKHLKFKSHWELFPQVAEVQATAAAMAAPLDPRQAALTPAALAELLTPAEKAAWVAAQVRASGRPRPGLAPYPPTHGAGGEYRLALPSAPGPAGPGPRAGEAREAMAALPWRGLPAAPKDAAEATAQGWVTEDHLADPELLRLWTETTAPDPYGVYRVLQDRRRALLTRVAPALGAAVALGSTVRQREALAQLDARAKALATQMAKLKAGEDIALKDVGGTLPPSAWSAREASREARKARLRAWHRLALAEKVRQDILAAGGTAPTEAALLASLAADQAAVAAQGPDDPRLVKGKKAKAAAKARAKAAAQGKADAEAAQRAARQASEAKAAAAALEVAAAAKALLLAQAPGEAPGEDSGEAPGKAPDAPVGGVGEVSGEAGAAGTAAPGPAGSTPGPKGPDAADAAVPAAPAPASEGAESEGAKAGESALEVATAQALAAAEALEADAAKALAAATGAGAGEAETEDPLEAAVKKVRSARADDLFLTAEGAVRVGQTLVKGKATDVGLWDPMYKALTWNHWMAPRWTPIVPALVGVTLWVHNGRTWVPVVPTDLAVGRKVGEYVPTRWLPWPYQAREREVKGGKAARKAVKDAAKGVKKAAPKAKGKQPAPKPARRPVPVILNPDAFWVSQ